MYVYTYVYIYIHYIYLSIYNLIRIPYLVRTHITHVLQELQQPARKKKMTWYQRRRKKQRQKDVKEKKRGLIFSRTRHGIHQAAQQYEDTYIERMSMRTRI